jgi:preprotein translocase subunit YajC
MYNLLISHWQLAITGVPQGPAGGVNIFFQLLPIIILFAVMYFLIIRPKHKQQKEHEKMVSALSKNDEIVTTGGIYGVIVNVKDKTVVIRVEDGKIEVDKSCVGMVVKKG